MCSAICSLWVSLYFLLHFFTRSLLSCSDNCTKRSLFLWDLRFRLHRRSAQRASSPCPLNLLDNGRRCTSRFPAEKTSLGVRLFPLQPAVFLLHSPLRFNAQTPLSFVVGSSPALGLRLDSKRENCFKKKRGLSSALPFTLAATALGG